MNEHRHTKPGWSEIDPIDETQHRRLTRKELLAALYAAIVGIILAVVAIGSQLYAWIQVQLNIGEGTASVANLWWRFTLPVVIGGALLCLPLIFAKQTRLKALGGLWIICLGLLLVGSFTRLIPVSRESLLFANQAIALALVAAALTLTRRYARWARKPGEKRSTPNVWYAAATGALMLFPWAFFGSFGGTLDTGVAGVCAIVAGYVASVLFGDTFWEAYKNASFSRRFWSGGSTIGVGLCLFGAGLGSGGTNLLILLTLPAAGYAIAVLTRTGKQTGLIVGVIIGPAVFGPMAYVDGDEFFPLVFGAEFGRWQILSAVIIILLVWVLACVFALFRRSRPRWMFPQFAAVIAILATLSATLFISPGFYNEKLLIVMKEKTDLSGITGTWEERLEAVQERLHETADRSQAPIRAELESRQIPYRPFYITNAIEVSGSLPTRAWAEARDDVAEVLLSPRLRPTLLPDPPMTGTHRTPRGIQPNISMIDADHAWEKGVTGKGITIGIPDSGIDRHQPAIADQFRGGDDSWADPVNGTALPTDPHGHGTHVAGIAVGSHGIGVAPDAEWIGCSSLPRNAGNPGDYLACLQFMFAPYPQGGDPYNDGDTSRSPHIVTNSWNCPYAEGCSDGTFAEAVSAFHAAGIFFVVAAGNSGPECGSANSEPGRYPEAYTVGAVDFRSRVASFSSRGPTKVDGSMYHVLDIAAPGQNVNNGNGILSAMPGDSYGRLPGTSMATPHVAGVVALMWSANEDLIGDIPTTRQILSDTATPARGDEVGSNGFAVACGFENSVGSGIVNALAAVEEAIDQ